jgi:hypothetical protein
MQTTAAAKTAASFQLSQGARSKKLRAGRADYARSTNEAHPKEWSQLWLFTLGRLCH